MQRRIFLRDFGLSASGIMLNKFLPVAGPFSSLDLKKFPIDKKLNPFWVNSLFNRGEFTKYFKSKGELRYIGMPVGGIGCGTVYLGGDGKLWLWDIFNANQLGASSKDLSLRLNANSNKGINNTGGALYITPLTPTGPIQTGIIISAWYKGHKFTKRLQSEDWEEIIFEASYPVGTCKYFDNNLPIEVELRSFSPFIPCDESNSSLPAIIQTLKVSNKSSEPIKIDVIGWMQNNTLPFTGEAYPWFERINQNFGDEKYGGIFFDCRTDDEDILNSPDYGNLAFSMICDGSIAKPTDLDFGIFKDDNQNSFELSSKMPIGFLSYSNSILPGRSIECDLIRTWFVPNLSFQGIADKTRFYVNDFRNAKDVADYVFKNLAKLKSETFLWMKTWYNSSLPYWFLERTFMNISTLATTTFHRLKSGRYYAWEGVGCCGGTCTHVWQYAQAAGRIFPNIEKDIRKRVDLGIAFQPDGSIWYRGELDKQSAIDGQAGTILRIYREHLMSTDSSFLEENWGKIKKAIQYLIAQDKNNDGMEDTPMLNTLDAVWYGEISWIVGICLAAVSAGREMAKEMNDYEFSNICTHYLTVGKENMETHLFNGEYFIQRQDPKIGKSKIGSYNTCHIDQVYGQSWAWQVGLDRIIDREKTLSALHSLWRYNYMPDLGPYLKTHRGGRYYALPGEGGMVMNTNPQNDSNPYGTVEAWQAGYFDECMTGFEHQVASHMMAEGMVEEAMILTKTIHDRYHAFKRNPFNEIECSDHYSRAMASYGTFITACGFTYHGPKGVIGFDPRISPENFFAPFVVAEGWGTFFQKMEEYKFSAIIEMKYGRIKLNKICLHIPEELSVRKIKVNMGKNNLIADFTQNEKAIVIKLNNMATILANQKMEISID